MNHVGQDHARQEIKTTKSATSRGGGGEELWNLHINWSFPPSLSLFEVDDSDTL